MSRIAHTPSVRAHIAAEYGTERRSRTLPSAVSTSRKSVRVRLSGPGAATRTVRSSAATSIRVPPYGDAAGTLHRTEPSAARHSTTTSRRVASTRPSPSPATARTAPCGS
ncbi:hypothetical protein ACFQ8S_19755 [Streptomyces virginiae]|uniref:hypothetical protein n=1 Tax=Streptomyces virginiae TaxID=1961 RepID=UPI0036801090